MKMKKVLVGFGIVGMLGVAAVACTDDGATEKQVSNVKSEQTAGIPEKQEKKEATKDNGTINVDKVIADTANVKATFTSVVLKKDEIFGDSYEIHFDIQNKTGKTITVQSRELSTDGKMVSDVIQSMSQDIAAGKSADSILTITKLDGYDFPEIKKNVELTLDFFNAESFDTIEKHKVNVNLK